MTDESAAGVLLDTHQHLIFPDRFRYSWTDSLPALANSRFTLAEYREATASSGILGTLFMESAVDDPYWRDETRYLASLAALPANRIVGIVAGCRPEEPARVFDAWLDELAAAPVTGFRRILHTQPDDLSTGAAFVRNVRELGKRGKSFDMCFLERQLPLAVRLAAQCDDTTLVLDHCGVPDIAAGNAESWRGHIRQLAAFPNVACKISGLVAYCPPDVPLEPAVRPYVEYCAERFGTGRLVWGSDWPVCNATSNAGDWAALFRRLMSSESAAARRAVFVENALRIYALDSRGIADGPAAGE